VLGDFQDEAHVVALDLEGGEDRGQLPFAELDVDDGADDLEVFLEFRIRGCGVAR
jgi:hypothetical protein